jgi:hypothetical protein
MMASDRPAIAFAKRRIAVLLIGGVKSAGFPCDEPRIGESDWCPLTELPRILSKCVFGTAHQNGASGGCWPEQLEFDLEQDCYPKRTALGVLTSGNLWEVNLVIASVKVV